jgi:uncharacterized protein (DUF427 family)
MKFLILACVCAASIALYMAMRYALKSSLFTRFYRVSRDPVQVGQESVWDYPRPPRLEKTNKNIKIVFNGVTIVDSNDAYRVLETSHPPVYYIPQKDIKMEYISRNSEHTSFCEWKGQCNYWDLDVNGHKLEAKIFSYENPTTSFVPIQGHLSFYAGPMDGCFVEGERVTPQPGYFYSGWITKDVVGPFKGSSGTMHW